MNISTSASDILNQISNLCYICQEPIKKLVTVLECDHILHFNCAIRFFAISENITCLVRNCQDRIKNIEAVKEDISDLAEALKPGNTPKGFLLLYENIDQAEKLLAHSEKNMIYVKKEVILSYYQLGKQMQKNLKIKKKSISGYNYNNEYALHIYGLWMQNAIKKTKRARENGKKIQACTLIQRKFIEYYYRPNGLCASELAQYYKLLWMI
ncbi:30503_t:CDS:2 [Gigaspora margarita]|uniref:30503_t:CDS:1 n=1 Tax=Gigaspora margarita TaxID=4874 RepID=A0ABN7W7H4_GIGMA|nr:30503_t:CDS:2 [Gigaspora margarita]